MAKVGSLFKLGSYSMLSLLQIGKSKVSLILQSPMPGLSEEAPFNRCQPGAPSVKPERNFTDGTL